MNEKDLAELRRRYRPDKSNITRVCGCFVNEQKEIISEFDQSLGLMPEEEAEQMLGTLKKVLSGTVGRNVLEIDFSTQQVMESEEYLLLAELRATKLKNPDLIKKMYAAVIESLDLEGNYVILLAQDTYDVPTYGADGERNETAGESFSYIVCCVCPVKSAHPVLSYYVPGNCFRSVGADTMLSAPALGFVFPAFDDRSANIYKALYYTKDLTDSHDELADRLFRSPIPMPAAAQKSAFDGILEGAMEEDCSLRVVRAVHTQVRQMIEAHKEEKSEEPLALTKDIAGDMLRYCGVPEERVTAFETRYEEEFGKDAEIHPKNVLAGSKMEVKTADVVIKVNAERADLLETRIIDGVRYILVRAEDEVEVNGVNIRI